MTNTLNPDVSLGRKVVDPQGDKIGTIGQVYLNDQTGQPDWITVNTCLFGMKENFAPLSGSTFSGDELVLPFDKSVVKDAPDVAEAGHLDTDEQDNLYAHYRSYLGAVTARAGVPQQTTTTGEAGYEQGQGSDTSGPNTDRAMTRSEEQLQVGTEKVQAGRARLRKYVVTEQQSVQLPVSLEEIRVEWEPITGTVTEQETVTGEVRKEQVEVDDTTPPSVTIPVEPRAGTPARRFEGRCFDQPPQANCRDRSCHIHPPRTAGHEPPTPTTGMRRPMIPGNLNHRRSCPSRPGNTSPVRPCGNSVKTSAPTSPPPSRTTRCWRCSRLSWRWCPCSACSGRPGKPVNSSTC